MVLNGGPFRMGPSLAACFVASLWLCASAHAQEQARRPNIVLLLIDDAGFSDLGAYGGEARTPNIDRLARSGAQFTRYYSSPLCAPSRAMLLTGVDNHRTGLATIPEVLPPEQRNRPGYSMQLEAGVDTIAQRLREAGYRTYMTGKWHLGHGPGALPDAHGFDRSFVLDASGADNWEQRPYMPYYDSAPWFEDGKPATLPPDFYSSEFLVDRMISYLDAGAGQTGPFFAYVAFQAVHIPVQAPAEFSAHYAHVYDAGWAELREARARRVRELGLYPSGAELAPMHPRLRTWETVPAGEQALYARSMAVHAGMLEAMDHHIGRLIAHLEQRGLAENTIFLVTSDNGPEPSNPLAERGFEQWMALEGYTRRLEDLGERRSYVFIGPEFASATASPGALFKFYASEGGLHVPLVVAGPGIAPRRVPARAFVTDVTPTLLELAGLPARARAGAAPIQGRSLRAVIEGAAQEVHPADASIGIEVSGNAALFRGDSKLVRNMPPYGDAAWRLYDLASDPGETRDLSRDQPERFASMRADYDAYAKSVGVLELPEGYDVHRQIAKNTIAQLWSHYRWMAALVGAALIAVLSLVVRLILRRRSAAAEKMS